MKIKGFYDSILRAPDAPGGAPAAPASPAPAAAGGGADQASFGVDAFLAYDGFAADGGQGGGGGEPAGGAPAPEPAPAAPAAPVQPAPAGGAPAAPAAQPQGADAALLAAANALAGAADRFTAAPAPAAPAAPAAPEPPPQYGFQVPDALATALNSDNPVERIQATQALVNGVASGTHMRVVLQMRQEFSQVVPQLIQQALEADRTQQEVRRDFYGTYQGLDSPLFHQMVVQEGAALGQETRASGWSQQFRDTLAVRVAARLTQLSGRPITAEMLKQKPGAPRAPAAPAGAPAADLGTPGGARPPIAAPGEDGGLQALVQWSLGGGSA